MVCWGRGVGLSFDVVMLDIMYRFMASVVPESKHFFGFNTELVFILGLCF